MDENNTKKDEIIQLLIEPEIRYIDLFCGTGGFTEAFKYSPSVNCVYANDMVQSSQQIYSLNHSNAVFDLKNLNDVDINLIPSHSMICGGFPCQPFSIAGKRLGFQDPRANVFWVIMSIVKKFQPRIFIFENVKNLTTHDEGNTFGTIKKALTDEGYNIIHKILDTCKITGIPQHRERIYIVGFKDVNIYNSFNLDFPTIALNPISSYLEQKVPEKYYYTNKFKVYEKINTDIRENKNNVCPTLTANMGGGGHNVPLLKDEKGIRKLTPRECFNLQGFPSYYKLPEIADSLLYKMAGNAITVTVANMIMRRIESLL